MIVWLARGVTRIVALVVLPVLAVVALGAAVAAVAGGRRTADAAEALGVTAAWRSVGDALAGGAVDERTLALVGAGALAGGLVLLVGVLVPRRERDLPLQDDETLAVRRRAIRQAVGHLAGGVNGVADARVRVRARRLRSGGRLRIRAARVARADASTVVPAVGARVRPVADALGLRTRVRGRAASSRKAALR